MTFWGEDYLFHPLEVSVCGNSGSGKTTLIEKLIKKFSSFHKVGYIKHGAHDFEIDKEGKDTYKAKKAGATNVAISSSLSSAMLLERQDIQFSYSQNFLDSEVVFIEGYKESLVKNKLLMWIDRDKDSLLLEKYISHNKEQVLAIVGISEKGPLESIPYFKRDEVDAIFNFIQGFWKDKISLSPLYGLVLSGGYSSRMGKDKGAMSYHGKSQIAYLFEILEKVTKKTYVSCRRNQTESCYLKQYPLIEDRYIDFGPTGGILSGFQKHPQGTWLVVACDMPFINTQVIEDLLKKRNPYKMATCFYNEEKKWAEPLCAVYESKSFLRLGQYLAMGNSCPRRVLMNSSIEMVTPESQEILKNVNTPTEYQQACDKI